MTSSLPSNSVVQLRKDLGRALRPPEKLSYSEWAAKNFRLSGNTAQPGRFKPWKFQRGILDAIGDPLIERVTVIKSARTGYTISLMAGIGAYAVNDPCPIILLMPTDDDARGIAVDEVDPAFRDTPALRDLMMVGRFDGRNTLTQRALLGGGSLKILSARAPRNLRRHTTKVLFCDEVDGMEVTKEGDPITIAEKRTISYADRKIVIGSTPVNEETSIVLPKYNESDKRVFEIPCYECGVLFELLWEHIDWTAGKPNTAVAICPSCGCTLDERRKPEMVEAGEWRATVEGRSSHAGFRLNALISMFSNVSWVKLVEEYEQAERAGPQEMQVFYNTNLGKVWSTSINYVNENELMARREDFGIKWDMNLHKWREDIPVEVCYITVGIDVQIDRFECTIVGWSEDHHWILGHHIIYGGTDLESTWEELDGFLGTEWKHPLGKHIGVEAAAIDSGDGNRTQHVYDYCEKVQHRKIVAIKGDNGPRPVLQVSKARKRNRTAPLYIVGVDQVKTDILTRLPREPGEKHSFRFSDGLETDYFVQLTSERRVLQYTKDGKPVIRFTVIGKRAQEGLDATVYGLAVRGVCRFDYAKRYTELRSDDEDKQSRLRDSVRKLHS